MGSGRETVYPGVCSHPMPQSPPNNVLERLKDRLLSALHKIERDIDRFSPPCSSSSSPMLMRPRSSSVCSISIPDTKQIVEQSLDQGLPIIPFGIPSFVILDPEDDSPKLRIKKSSRIMESQIIEETSGYQTPPYSSLQGMVTPPLLGMMTPPILKGRKTPPTSDKSVRDRVNKKEKRERYKHLQQAKKYASLQEEWRMEGNNKADYMLLDFSK